MPQHCFGVRLNGKTYRLSGEFDDEQFQELTQKGLPPRWVAWHFSEGENVTNSERARQVLALEPLTGGNPYWCTVEPPGHVRAEPYLRHWLKTGQDLLQAWARSGASAGEGA